MTEMITKVNAGGFDEELAECAHPFGSLAYQIITQHIHFGKSKLESTLAKKQCKAKKAAAEQQQAQLKLGEQLAKQAAMAEEEREAAALQEHQVLGEYQALATMVKPFAFQSENLLLAQCHVFDAI